MGNSLTVYNSSAPTESLKVGYDLRQINFLPKNSNPDKI